MTRASLSLSPRPVPNISEALEFCLRRGARLHGAPPCARGTRRYHRARRRQEQCTWAISVEARPRAWEASGGWNVNVRRLATEVAVPGRTSDTELVDRVRRLGTSRHRARSAFLDAGAVVLAVASHLPVAHLSTLFPYERSAATRGSRRLLTAQQVANLLRGPNHGLTRLRATARGRAARSASSQDGRPGEVVERKLEMAPRRALCALTPRVGEKSDSVSFVRLQHRHVEPGSAKTPEIPPHTASAAAHLRGDDSTSLQYA